MCKKMCCTVKIELFGLYGMFGQDHLSWGTGG